MKTHRRRSQIYPLWRAFSNLCVYGERFHRLRVDGRPKRIKKFAFTSVCVYNRLRVDGASVAKVCGVRYSELSRLPYINKVDNFLIDPVHNFFLGLVEDVGNAIIEGDARFIDGEGRHVFQERMNNMRLLYDDGRLPYAMLSKMSRGKNFIVTFARECLWKQVREETGQMSYRSM